MINEIKHSLLTTDEEIGLYSKVLEYLKGMDPDGLQLTPFFQKFQQTTEQATRASHEATNSLYTATLRNYEKRRDSGFVSFRDITDAISKSINPDKAALASIITRIIRSHNWSLQTLGDKKQSAMMESLILDLLKPEAQNAISTLNIMEYYNDMITSHRDFLAQENNRNQEKLNSEKFDYSTVYKEMESAAANLFNAIKVYHSATGKQEYVTIAENVNIIAEQYMAVARARKTRNQNKNQEITQPVNEQ